MNVFFAEQLTERGGVITGDEAHHASRVLRLSIGDSVFTTQGKGVIYKSLIDQVDKKQLRFINQGIAKQEAPTYNLHLAVAPTKSNDRFEFFLEKATELGVSEITPIRCANSERKVYKHARGQKIVQSAAKQSLRANWPVFNEMISLQALLENAAEENKWIAHCEATPKESFLKVPPTQNALILIGPEGDFNTQEIEIAQTNGFKPIDLGNARLRTETAAITACMHFYASFT